MSYEFKKLADVESLNEVPEVATVLAEVSGEIKRIPSSGLGGVVKTAIIKDSGYDEAITLLTNSTPAPAMAADLAPEYTYSCLNMTFEEAYETMASGEPLDVFGMLTGEEGAINIHGIAAFTGTTMIGVPCIGVMFNSGSFTIARLYWTADGLSTSMPGDNN